MAYEMTDGSRRVSTIINTRGCQDCRALNMLRWTQGKQPKSSRTLNFLRKARNADIVRILAGSNRWQQGTIPAKRLLEADVWDWPPSVPDDSARAQVCLLYVYFRESSLAANPGFRQ